MWHNVLETTIGTLPPREDAGRTAVLVVDTHARTGEVAKAVCQMISNMKAPLYYWGITAENKQVDENEFFQDHFEDCLKTDLLNNTIKFPHGKLDDPEDIREEDVPIPHLTKLQWEGDAGRELKMPDDLVKRWGEHSLYGDEFKQLIEDIESTKTGNMDDRTSTKRQRDETGKTPDEVKRIKRETRTEAEKDSSQLPSSSPLTKINIPNQVDIIVINCEFDECCK